MTAHATRPAERRRASSLEAAGLTPQRAVHWNLGPPELYEHAVRRAEGVITEGGAFCAVTAPHTGRSPNDKFIVREPASADEIQWNRLNQPLEPAQFERLKAAALAHLSGQELFVRDLFAGADAEHRSGIRFVTPNAWHALFVHNMFLRPSPADLASFSPAWTVLHTPEFQADPATHGTRSGTFVVIHFGQRMILIGGTRYAGEMKKSVFTILNYLLPKRGILSMHCSANLGRAGDVALGRPGPGADRGRRARLVRPGDFQLRGRLLREGHPPVARGRARNLRDHPHVRHGARERGGGPRDPRGRPRLGSDHREHPRVVPHPLHPEPRPGRGGRAPVAYPVPHLRRVRDHAADRPPLAGAGDVPLPAAQPQRLLLAARREDRHPRRAVLAGQHRVDGWTLRRGPAHPAWLHACHGTRRARREARPYPHHARPRVRSRSSAAGPRRAGKPASAARHLERAGGLRCPGRAPRADVPGQLRPVPGPRARRGRGRGATGIGLSTAPKSRE